MNVGKQVRRSAILRVGLLAVFAVSSAWADTLVDPSTLQIGPGAGTACAQGCAGDPNVIGAPGNVLDIYQQSNDQTSLFSTSPITGVTFINPYPNTGSSTVTTGSGGFASSGTYGINTLTNGFAGFETSSDVYTFIGLGNQVNNSNSIGNLAGCPASGGNWTCTDLSKLGIPANGFGVYVFALTGGDLGPNGLVVPEPATLALFGTGLIAVGMLFRRRLSK